MRYFNQLAGAGEDLLLLIACLHSCARIEKEEKISWI